MDAMDATCVEYPSSCGPALGQSVLSFGARSLEGVDSELLIVRGFILLTLRVEALHQHMFLLHFRE